MRRLAKLLSVVPVALIVGMAACDNAQNMTAPQQKVSAQFAAQGGPHRVTAIVSGGTDEAVIGASGGTISVTDAGNHVIAILYVPAGTVKKNTTFTVDVDGDYTVELTATSEHGATNDVGTAGFRKGVTLYLNKAYLHPGANMILGVAQLKANGQLVKVESSEDSQWLIGTLRHFSTYVPTEECCYAPIED